MPPPTSVDLDRAFPALTFRRPVFLMRLIDVRPTEGDLGVAAPWRIRSGDRGRSVLYERVRRRGTGQVPPLGSTVADAAAVEMLGRWIDTLK